MLNFSKLREFHYIQNVLHKQLYITLHFCFIIPLEKISYSLILDVFNMSKYKSQQDFLVQ